MLEFDESGHVYRWNGGVVPSVTGIIAPLSGGFFERVKPDVLERARQEGVAMHKTVELDCRGELDVDNLPDWLVPRYKAWRKFVAETGFELLASEQKVYNAHYGYAGTFDLAGVMTKLKRAPREAIIDIKRTLTGAPAVGVQLAGYLDSWNRKEPKERRASRRFGLQLMSTGEYRAPEFNSTDDFPTFLACIQLLRWKEKNQ